MAENQGKAFEAKDDGERLFKRYAEANGYEMLAYEPDLGTDKRPDYLIRAGDRDLVVEVESFVQATAWPTYNGAINMKPYLTRVRDKIKNGADQLKGIGGYPLVVVLANPANAYLPLDGAMFFGAMYGDLEVTFEEGGGLRMQTGRNGRMHVDEPDGSSRGHHPHVSAIAVLRTTYTEDAHTAAILEAQSKGYTNPIAAVRFALQSLADLDETSDEIVCLDVFETVSQSAVPLAREALAGPYDSRWGQVSPGRYGRIHPPTGAVHVVAEGPAE
ncbi:MAG TPA: hypothetical protein VL551_07090 [Actinospica sp.]|jgi:hypothetical protein|nr:hypothetical protein [Actinospica sp.]